MQLEPTEDIVFFPALLTLKPKETRRVRVGSATETDVREKTYRIFVEELPPLDELCERRSRADEDGHSDLRAAGKGSGDGDIERSAAAERHAAFHADQRGHRPFRAAEHQGEGTRGLEHRVRSGPEGWYVLAGGRREFEMAFPKTECARVTSIIVDIQFGSGKLQERLQTPNGACSR